MRGLFYIVLPFLIVPFQILAGIWPFIHVHGRANPNTSRYIPFFASTAGHPRLILYTTCSTLAPSPLQAAQTSTP